MKLPNTPKNQAIAEAVATLAIENMYPDEAFIKEILKVENGEKTYEQLRQEILAEYRGKRQHDADKQIDDGLCKGTEKDIRP